ncbi:MAG TPA: hypothetical protein VFC46_10110 [Humisphaera sp.]|nr:hypothetical protein [Humisphaera sp.]
MTPLQQPAGWQAGFVSIMPSVQTHAKIRFRKLPAERREEAIQETIAAACMHYQLAAVQGKLDVVRPGPLADFAVRHVRTGRHVGGKQNGAKDVLSPVCHKRHGVTVINFHAHCAGIGRGAGWRQVAIEDRKVPIPDLAAFRIDYAHWLRTLTRRDRKIIAAFTSGEGTAAVAGRFGISPGRVSQLRRKYEHLWHVYQGEPTGRAA